MAVVEPPAGPRRGRGGAAGSPRRMSWMTHSWCRMRWMGHSRRRNRAPEPWLALAAKW